MRALKDNHFNSSFSHRHLVATPHNPVVSRVVSLVPEVSPVEAQVVSRVEGPVVSLEALEGGQAAIPQCQWDRLQPLLHKCNNYPQASHSKVPVV